MLATWRTPISQVPSTTICNNLTICSGVYWNCMKIWNKKFIFTNPMRCMINNELHGFHVYLTCLIYRITLPCYTVKSLRKLAIVNSVSLQQEHSRKKTKRENEASKTQLVHRYYQILYLLTPVHLWVYTLLVHILWKKTCKLIPWLSISYYGSVIYRKSFFVINASLDDKN